MSWKILVNGKDYPIYEVENKKCLNHQPDLKDVIPNHPHEPVLCHQSLYLHVPHVILNGGRFHRGFRTWTGVFLLLISVGDTRPPRMSFLLDMQ